MCIRKKSRFLIGRKTQVIDCRETPGIGFGGGLAQRGTLSEGETPDVIVFSMGPTARHITKPVCEITYGLREAGIPTSVMVLEAGIGPPVTASGTLLEGVGSVSGINYKEIDRAGKFKLALLHFGNIPAHFIPKAKLFLDNIDIPAIIVCQAPVAFGDFAKQNVKTIEVMPEEPETKGVVVDLVTGVIRGQTVSQIKMNEIISKVKKVLSRQN